jgi:cellobiose-specific phosphotransferase system component IIC
VPPGTSAFYSTAAQIIPVLILVLIVEQRDEKRRLTPLANLIYVVATIGAATVGEIIALRAVYRGYAHRQDQDVVIGALVACALALVVPIVTSSLHEIEATGKKWTTATAWTIAVIVAYVVVVIFVAVLQQT